jgi:asparagine synthase (glutamine-hydrolysing)
MFQYFAFVWPPTEPSACEAARRAIERLLAQRTPWRVAMYEPGLHISYAGENSCERAVVLPDRQGVILGTLFDRTGADTDEIPGQRVSLSDRDAARVLDSAGHVLIEEFWGNYVAILRSPRTHMKWVLRGPASLLPCLNSGADGVDFYFSSMESCAQLSPGSFAIDWRCVARTLLGPCISTRTGLEAVRELLPGTCYELHDETRRTLCYWNPADVARNPPMADPSRAASALRRATQSCVHAWASTAPRILHCLSGGLDSSIVLGLLSEAPTHPRITCLNHFSTGPNEDERSFARAVVRMARCELIEYARDAECDLRASVPALRFEISPGLCLREVERIDQDAASEIGASAIFRGHGGDELFCRHHTQNAVVDFIRTRGLRHGLLPLAMHAAMLEGLTVWDVLARSVAEALVPRHWNLAALYCQDQEGQSLLAPDILRELLSDESFDAPFLSAAQDLPPGKLWQLSMLCGRRHFYGAFETASDPPRISPLLSQPVIETCLQIPTYLQMLGRRDRALARMAFADVLPYEVLKRRSKGGAEQLARRILARNIPFVRECLLDGQLVQQRIADRQRLEAALGRGPSTDAASSVPLFDLLGMELWLYSLSTDEKPGNAVRHRRVGALPCQSSRP